MAQDVIVDGLRRLEYRGYDSAGIAIVDGALHLHKEKGELDRLTENLPEINGQLGIGHTRWATHGAPNQVNAHPHRDCSGEIVVIHNGIIDNYAALKAEIGPHTYSSETDTEVVAHLIEAEWDGDLLTSTMKALRRIEGSYGLVVISSRDPGRIVAARQESPLVLGFGKGENLVASDLAALIKYTNSVTYLHNGQITDVRADEVKVYDLGGDEVGFERETVEWNLEQAEKGGFPHYMLKEIHEQSQSIQACLGGRTTVEELVQLPQLYSDSLHIVACGTAYHAALVGAYLFEELVGLPTRVSMASEFRYSPLHSLETQVIFVSQSGETADTLAACREARGRGARCLAVCNVPGSSLTREANNTILIRSGPEIGVAATKTFTGQVVTLGLLALATAHARARLSPGRVEELLKGFRNLPRVIRGVLTQEAEIRQAAEMLFEAQSVFFLGRQIAYPIALEGALKLKEISYIHAEGYPGGELKHGPLALVSNETPVVAIAMESGAYPKMIGNMREVSAREAPVLALATEGDMNIAEVADEVIYLPRTDPLLATIPVSVALQLISYYVASHLGCSIDKPRNLAKSVTVE